MINLSLDHSRYIAMDNRQQINSDSNKVSRAEILGKIKPIFFQHFEQAVDACCMRIDLEFGLQLGKNRERLTKDQYIKLLEYLHSVRKEIKQNYLFKVNEFFDGSYPETANDRNGQLDFSKVALLSEDTVKENHVITQIIRQCEHSYYEELVEFNKQFVLQQGKQVIAGSQNPIFPEKLVRALVESVKPLKLNSEERIALYKAFEANVFSQLRFIYRELIKQFAPATTAPDSLAALELRPAGRIIPAVDALGSAEAEAEQSKDVPSLGPLYVVSVIKEEVEPVCASDEQPSVEFGLLQKKLELWRMAHSPSAYDLIPVTGNSFYEHFEIKNALQILQQFSDDADSAAKRQPLKCRVLEKLEELSFSNKVKYMARNDEDILDLATLIFSEIERDELLETPVKTAVLRLEIPLAAASLGQYSIFTSAGNPVRQLLDDLFATGLFLNGDEYDDRLIQECIASTVKKMTKNSGFELSGWSTEADEFSNYLNKQKQRSRNIEDKAKQFMENKLALEASRKIVAIVIENSMQGKELPAAIVEFLRNVWSNVLLDAYTGKDEQPEQWAKSVQAMDELIISVMPPADDHQRKQILKMLPGMIAELRRGLKQISYEKPAQSRFFKDLAVWHIILMDKKEAKKTVGDIASAVPAEGEEIKVEAITDDYSAQAKILAEGSWVAFSSELGKQWGKLLWKDAGTEAMLFVGKNGAKLFEMPAADLAEKLRKGQAEIVKLDKKTITERVLSELMSL
jgi:hypothetical protein